MNKKVYYALHGIIVLLVVVSTMLTANSTYQYYKESYSFHLTESVLFHVWLLFPVYTAYYFFPPKYLVKQKPVWFFLTISLILAAGIVLFYVITISISKYSIVTANLFKTRSFLSIACFTFFLGVLGTCVRLFIQWLKDAAFQQEIIVQQTKTELDLLKNQLKPHFLFNTLNNIDSLIIEQSPLASPALNKLSGIMRYVVYKSDNEMTALTEELKYLRDYIDLQKMRLHNPELIKFNILGEPGGKLIAPMLFVPFVENIFKHGTLTNRPKNEIRIIFTITANKLSFYCENAFSETLVNGIQEAGKGISIVKRRLELLYPAAYYLKITQHMDKYTVNLDLNLA